MSAATRSTSSRMSTDDMKDGRVPQCLFWDCQQVADFVEDLGYPQYKDCFLTNLVNGRKLVHCHASSMPKLGITDFKHIKHITGAVREILELENPDWARSIGDRPRSDLALYLELKAFSGPRGDDLTYKSFLYKYDKTIFRPPLSNHTAIIPHD